MKPQLEKVAVLGRGAYAAALATALSGSYRSVAFLVKSADDAVAFNKTHLLAGRFATVETFKGNNPHLPENIVATASMDEALRGAQLIVVAPSTKGMPALARRIHQASREIRPDALLVVGTKGVNFRTDGTLETMPEALAGVLSSNFRHRIVYVTGLAFASDLVQGDKAALVVAGDSKTDLGSAFPKGDTALRAALRLLPSSQLTFVPCDDIHGAAIAAALKNPYALLAGMAYGLGNGSSTTLTTLSAVARREYESLCGAHGAKPETLKLAPIDSDFTGTFLAPGSRNFRAGSLLVGGPVPSGSVENRRQPADPRTAAAVQALIGEAVEGILLLEALNRSPNSLRPLRTAPLLRSVLGVVAGKANVGKARETVTRLLAKLATTSEYAPLGGHGSGRVGRV